MGTCDGVQGRLFECVCGCVGMVSMGEGCECVHFGMCGVGCVTVVRVW